MSEHNTNYQIDADFLTTISNLTQPLVTTIEDVNGRSSTFSSKDLHEVKASAPSAFPHINVTTLTGFADLIRNKIENEPLSSDYLIHVCSEELVTLTAKESDNWGRRDVLVKAAPVSFTKFSFGQWMEQDRFAIALASLFADGGDKDYVVSLSSSITNEAVGSSDDDGFTQRVTAKVGIQHKQAISIKPRVLLSPYRTFPEIEQPMSQFVLRARCQDGRTPELMLIEADGGKWKIDAMNSISKWMKEANLDVPIIA